MVRLLLHSFCAIKGSFLLLRFTLYFAQRFCITLHNRKENKMLTSEQAKKNQEKYGFNELTEGKRKCTPDISGTIQRFSGYYIDCISGHIRNSRRCGERNCYLRRDHDERGSGNDTDGKGGAVTGQFKAVIGTGSQGCA